MLRLDPGEGRIAHRPRSSRAWEGGGEYNVARGLRRCFGLRTGDRHRARRQRGRPAGRGPHPQGGVDTSLVRWVPYDGIGRERPQRAELHRARLRRARRGRRARTAATPRPPSCARATSTGSDLFGDARRALAAHAAASSRALSDTTADGRARGGQAAAQRHGTVVSYDLNYRPSRCGRRIGGQAARAGGQPRARRARRRDDRQRGGLHRAPRLRGRRCRREPARPRRRPLTSAMIDERGARSTRTSRSSPPRCARCTPRRVNDWGAIAWRGRAFVEATHAARPGDPRPRRRRRLLRVGPDLRAPRGRRPAEGASSTARRTARSR